MIGAPIRSAFRQESVKKKKKGRGRRPFFLCAKEERLKLLATIFLDLFEGIQASFEIVATFAAARRLTPRHPRLKVFIPEGPRPTLRRARVIEHAFARVAIQEDAIAVRVLADAELIADRADGF